MAVYERTYKRYAGETTPQWTRFLVLPRYAVKDVFKSKLFLVVFVASFIFPLLDGGMIYLRHNASFLEAFPDFNLDEFLAIDARFFHLLLNVQLTFAFVLALFMGPGLVSRDLANNGLPLYLSRPFSRAEYVAGKLTILVAMLSAITWVAGLGLFALQGNYAGWGWMVENIDLAVAVVVASWAWIALISLMALAMSAWVRWRPVAAFMMLAVLLAGGFFGTIINALFRVEWGSLINLIVVIGTILDGAFGLRSGPGISVGLAWMSLLAFGTFFLYLLHRKIRAYEVVK